MNGTLREQAGMYTHFRTYETGVNENFILFKLFSLQNTCRQFHEVDRLTQVYCIFVFVLFLIDQFIY